MGKRWANVVFLVVMIVTVVGIDFAFFRGSGLTFERLAANIGVVAAFAAIYFLFIRKLAR